jgi:hypothetical protein
LCIFELKEGKEGKLREGKERSEIFFILAEVQSKRATVAMTGRAIGIINRIAAISYPSGE